MTIVNCQIYKNYTFIITGTQLIFRTCFSVKKLIE